MVSGRLLAREVAQPRGGSGLRNGLNGPGAISLFGKGSRKPRGFLVHAILGQRTSLGENARRLVRILPSGSHHIVHQSWNPLGAARANFICLNHAVDLKMNLARANNGSGQPSENG